MQQKDKNLWLHGVLYKAVKHLPPTPRVSKPEPKKKGIVSHIPDEVILDMRWQHEFGGKSLRQIEQLYPQYNTTNYIYKVLQYEIRGKLIPKKEMKK